MIKDMKKYMLIKLNNRYTKSQEFFLSICSLLDIRYKQKVTTNDNFNMKVFTVYFFNMCSQENDAKAK